MDSNPHIIGLTGSFGSGCSYIANEILAKKGYTCYSLSGILKGCFIKETKKDIEKARRKDLQNFGDEKRKNHGSDYFAKKLLEKICSDYKKDNNKKFIVDSIRNPSEIYCFRDYSTRFFLFGIYASVDIRWDRVCEIYSNDKKTFDEDDENDTGRDNQENGQRVQDCFYESDVVLNNGTNYDTTGNDAFLTFEKKTLQYVDLVADPLSRKRAIKREEALMAMAYAASQSSSCIKRKVGAVIVDESDNVISSGYNEVPRDDKPCDARYQECYRSRVWKKFFTTLAEEIPEFKDKKTALETRLRKNFKNLDLCRALHAEENAIVNLAKNGNSTNLENCTIYTTTYPCRMCANKIVNVGIKRVRYLEPYPDPEAKVILKNNDIQDYSFEGVTFKSYFRLYGEKK